MTLNKMSYRNYIFCLALECMYFSLKWLQIESEQLLALLMIITVSYSFRNFMQLV